MERRGVAVYLEVFVLVGVALLGSALVFAAVSKYTSGDGGASVSISDLTIRQGDEAAVERMVVSNTGTVPVSTLEVDTSGVSSGVQFCYVVSDTESAETLESTCPTLSSMSPTVSLSAPIPQGQSVVVEFTIQGQAFVTGSTSEVVVVAADGAQASLSALVVPA